MNLDALQEYRKKYPGLFNLLEKTLDRYPRLDAVLKTPGVVKAEIDAQRKQVLEVIGAEMKPYREKYETFRELPPEGRARRGAGRA